VFFSSSFFFFTRTDYKESKGLRTPLRPFSDLSERRADLNLDDGVRAVRLSRSAARYFGPAACVSPRETNNALLPLRGVPCPIDSDACNRYTGISASFRDWNRRREYLPIYFIPPWQVKIVSSES